MIRIGSAYMPKKAEERTQIANNNWTRYRTVVSLTIDPELLAQIDAMAKRKHISRAALIAMWTSERLEVENGKTIS